MADDNILKEAVKEFEQARLELEQQAQRANALRKSNREHLSKVKQAMQQTGVTRVEFAKGNLVIKLVKQKKFKRPKPDKIISRLSLKLNIPLAVVEAAYEAAAHAPEDDQEIEDVVIAVSPKGVGQRAYKNALAKERDAAADPSVASDMEA